MTAEQWLTDHDCERMLTYLAEQNGSRRKLQLFAVACCRSIWHLLTDERSRAVVIAVERQVEGQTTMDEVATAAAAAWEASSRLENNAQDAADAAAATANPPEDIFDYGFRVAFGAGDAMWVRGKDRDDELARQADLVRDIFGNPFRPVTADPSWLTPTVVQLAEHIYADRAFDQMPILADALQDAGCYNAEILGHCRSDGPHVRGCFVGDLLLGKS